MSTIAPKGPLDFCSITIDSRSTPNAKLGRRVVPGLAMREWNEQKLREWGPEDARYQSEVCGEFPSRDQTRLISDVELAGAFDRWSAVSDDGPLMFGIDPAGGGGGDQSVIAARRGLKVFSIAAFNGATDEIVSRLLMTAGRMRIGREAWHVNFDGSSSWGADLHAALRKVKLRDDTLTFEALDMKGGNAKTDFVLRVSKCARRIDAMWLNMAIALKTSVGVPYDAELREELIFAEWEQDREGGTRLREKRSFRKLIGRSPDRSDALAFCLWEGRVQALSEAARVPLEADDVFEVDQASARRRAAPLSPYEGAISPFGEEERDDEDDS